MKRVSFDFDGTLSRMDVQDYAQSLIYQGFDVWIVTSRLHEKYADNLQWNDDLYDVAREVGIPDFKIHFMNWHNTEQDKWEFFKDNDFVWHLDDDFTEVNAINKKTKTRGISVFGNSTWKNKCDKLLK